MFGAEVIVLYRIVGGPHDGRSIDLIASGRKWIAFPPEMTRMTPAKWRETYEKVEPIIQPNVYYRVEGGELIYDPSPDFTGRLVELTRRTPQDN